MAATLFDDDNQNMLMAPAGLVYPPSSDWLIGPKRIVVRCIVYVRVIIKTI